MGFILPITDTGLTVLEADDLCQKTTESIIQKDQAEAEICEHAKFFNAIYFLFGIGLIMIFWGGFLERQYLKK